MKVNLNDKNGQEQMTVDLDSVIAKLRTWPIDQIFVETVPCSIYRQQDGSFNNSKLILDVWNTALDNISAEATRVGKHK